MFSSAHISSYAVPAHVYWCLTPDGVVFLDLRRDEYIGIGQERLRALRRVLPGFVDDNACSGETAFYEIDTAISGVEVAEELVEQGLLTKVASFGSSLRRKTYELADARLYDAFRHASPPVTWQHAYGLLTACTKAVYCMKLFSLEQIVSYIQTQKRRLPERPTADSVTKARALLGVFLKLRPFIYTSRGHCLFDSLVLMHFMLSHGIAPGWYFGVQTRPFKAHSWVQFGRWTLNVAPEHARSFTPILVV